MVFLGSETTHARARLQANSLKLRASEIAADTERYARLLGDELSRGAGARKIGADDPVRPPDADAAHGFPLPTGFFLE